MADDVVINKSAIIERCIARVREEYAGDERNLTENPTRQDSIILNLQRACEAAIDLAMHVVRHRRLDVPQETRDAFRFLQDAAIISPKVADRLMRMVGFRNVAIHDYRRLDLQIVRQIITSHLDHFLAFTATLLKTGRLTGGGTASLPLAVVVVAREIDARGRGRRAPIGVNLSNRVTWRPPA